MMNLVIMTGRLCRDPELRYTPSNTAVCQIRIAVDREHQEKDGSRKADFFNVIFWAGKAEFVNKYFGKGQPITVIGSIQNREYTDREGKTVTVTEIVGDKAHFAGGGQKIGPSSPAEAGASNKGSQEEYEGFYEVEDGELPF